MVAVILGGVLILVTIGSQLWFALVQWGVIQP